MKCKIPEISWHNREPVLSVDIHPTCNDFYRLASGGGDSHVLIWQMILTDTGAIKQEVISDLTRHQRAVNTVRWSPSGQYLASADDDANIIIWQLKNDNIPLLEGDLGDKEVWNVFKVLRGHKEDIYDLCWSVDGLMLFSGSVDNTAILWNLKNGKLDHILSDHKGFVQGVAWDPKGQVLATISTDRICRIFDITGKQVKARIHKGKLPVPASHYLYEKEIKFFHDDTFKSFFRRLHFTPDGSLLIVPSGHIESEDCKVQCNATFVFTMDNWNGPAAVLPLPRQCSTVVRCCPILFELRKDGPDPVVKLPYRMIIAVGTDHDVILYDTQQCKPFARFHEIHYTRLTDLTWSSDGILLTASSTDGFCALITFEPEELGKAYVKEESNAEENPLEISCCEEIIAVDKDENVDINDKELKDKETDAKKRPSFIEQWALSTPKKIKLDLKNKKTKLDDNIIEIIDDEEDEPKKLPMELRVVITRLIPRRITPTKIENIKNSIKDDYSVAKPIEVRRKPKSAEVKNTATPRGCENVVQPEVVSKSSGDKIMEKPVKHIIVEDLLSKNKVSNYTDAKPIAIRRKPRDYKIVESEKNKEMIYVEPIGDKKNSKNESVDQNPDFIVKNLHKNELGQLDAKPVALQKHLKEHFIRKKGKVNSIVRKKLSIAPSKSNPLLNFLKTSKEAKKDKSSKGSSILDLSIDEDEARDAWNNEGSPKAKCESQDIAASVDDSTEDFCLQLEESQPSGEIFNHNEVQKTDIKMSCVDGSIKKDKVPDIVIDLVQSSDDDAEASSSTKRKNLEDNLPQKVPRRVPLITISSPKGKKKQKT